MAHGDAFLRRTVRFLRRTCASRRNKESVHRTDLVHLDGVLRGLEKIPGLCHSGGGVAMWVACRAKRHAKNRTNPTAAETLAFSEDEPENEPGITEAFERRAPITA